MLRYTPTGIGIFRPSEHEHEHEHDFVALYFGLAYQHLAARRAPHQNGAKRRLQETSAAL